MYVVVISLAAKAWQEQGGTSGGLLLEITGAERSNQSPLHSPRIEITAEAGKGALSV